MLAMKWLLNIEKTPFSRSIKEKFFLLVQDTGIKISLRGFLGIITLFTLVLIWKWNHLPPQIPLFYSLPYGTEILGKKIQIFLLPFLTLTIFTLNLTFAIFIYKKEKLLAKILIFGGIFVAFLLFLTFLQIVFLIT